MPEERRGGRRPGAGRPPGSKTKNPSAERALLALLKSAEDAIREKNWQLARERTQQLEYILRFIPNTPPAE